MTRPRLRAIHSPNAQLAELARDAQQALDTIAETRLVSFTGVYTEPMLIKYEHEPLGGIHLLRVRDDAAPEQAVQCGGSPLSFVYRGGSIEVTAIEGLIEGTKYRFCFEVVG